MDNTNSIIGSPAPAATGDEAVISSAAPAPSGGSAAAADNFNWGSIVSENGGFSDNWKDSLPEDLKQEKCFDNIHTLPSLLKSYAAAQKMVGANKVSIPSENSSQEEWDAFYKAAGRPDTADAYSVDKIEIPAGVALDEATVKSFRDFAFSHGMSQKAFEDAVKFDLERFNSAQALASQRADQEYNETLSRLQKEYGSNLSTVVAQCNKALETFGLADVFREKGLLNNYSCIKALANIGASISESKLQDGDAPVAARNPEHELAALQADPAFTDRYHPQHDIAVKKAQELLNEIIRNRK